MSGRSTARRTRRVRPAQSGGTRSRVGLAALVAMSVLVSLLPGVPGWAAPPASAASKPPRPAVQHLDDDGGPVKGKAWHQERVKDGPVPAPVWPKAATKRVDLATAGAAAATARGVKAGDLPVWIGRDPGATDRQVSKVDVQVVDRNTLPDGWRDGLVVKATAPHGIPAGMAKVSVDYSGFRYAAGGQWASRVRLWQVPECALSTPDKKQCRPVALRTSNDLAAGVASAQVSVGSADGPASLVVLAAAASGSDGDFAATSLSPSSSWSAGTETGEFSWNYPLRMPPATGPAPGVSFAYSSSAVDGRSEVTNNQPSWIGEGFDYSPGYIERRYVPCAEDKKDGANNTENNGDLCWRSDNATMNLNNRSSELIFQSGKGWHNRTEDGSKIEKLTGAGNGDAGGSADTGEYWKVTTTDGTQYFFGRHSLPGQTAKTNSTLTVPVFGNHSGEPCHATSFNASDCVQAWRWNLDYVVDVHGNTMSLWYEKETNNYAQNNTQSAVVGYDRAGTLTRIDYGTYDRVADTHGVTERSVTPYAQVVFDTDKRCFTNCGTETDPVKANWKDTPWDQQCRSTTSCQQYQPTFWTANRLKKVTTRVWDTTKAPAAWQDVESWTLSHTFAATADSTHQGLWLDQIDHTGLVGDTDISLPPVTFEAISMPNRVLTEHGTTDNWLRIASIKTETGARIKVDYSDPECTEAIVATLQPHTNTRRCYPVKVPDPDDPTGEALVTEWWHKYVVKHVVEDDVQLEGGHQADSMHTWYEYVGSPAWHYADDDGLSRPDRKTWAQWRGYGQVKTQVGHDAAVRTLVVTTFMRGMHGDRSSPAGGTRTVTVPASLGAETVYDEDQFAGQIREQVVYNGVESKPVSKTVSVPWRSNPTASRTINGDLVEARFVNTLTTYSATALGVDGSRGWRTARSTKSLDHTYGTVNWSQDDGDVNVTGDEQCVANSYNRNTGKNLTQLVKQTTTTALPCGTAPTSVDDVISDARYYYDGGATVDVAPTFGDVSKTEQLKSWTPTAGTVWQVVSQGTVDSTGRSKTSTDIKGNVTTTVYTPAVGGPVTNVATTNALNWTSKVDVNPYWGSTQKATDPNNRVSGEFEYDALGRVSKAWKLGWSKAGHEDRPSVRYTYTFAAGRDAYPFIKTEAMNPDGNYVTSYQILDGLLRPRQIQTLSLGGSGDRVVTDTLYDEFGRTATTYGAHAEPGAPAGVLWWEPEWSVPAMTKTVFDRASRATNSIFLSGDEESVVAEQWRTVTQHEGDLTKTTPPEGGTPTTTVTDIQGRVVALRQHTTPTGVDGAYQQTTYVFDRKGQPVKTVDPAGNEWTNEYDVKGRVWRVKDPDKGTTTIQYNDFDEQEKTTDARGASLWYVYDQLGRKRQLRDDSATGPLRAEWRYDTLYTTEPGWRGQLTQAIRYEPPGSTNAYKMQVSGFTGRYQPAGVIYVIPTVEADLGGSYSYGYSYSAFTGAPTSVNYPPIGQLTGELVTTDYDPTTGMPVRLDTGIPGVDAATMATATYDAQGARISTGYTRPGRDLVEELIYRDEHTRRVSRSVVVPSSTNSSIADRHYKYDDFGNITSIADTPQTGQADTQCFRHDLLGQLATAWTPKAGVSCDTDPAVGNLGGPAPYWQDWTFNTTGSRLTETSHTAGGNTTREYTVPAGGTNVARPHATTQMTTTAPGQSPVVSAYAYDNAGNTTCRPAGTAANNCATNTSSQTLAWDNEGRLATVTTGGETIETNIYDAEGNRIVRRDATGTTIYLPGQELRREGATKTGTRYYEFAGTICASRTGTNSDAALTWLFNDHQGTQQAAVNATTGAVTIRRQTPYGTPRGFVPTNWPNEKGFVGGTVDPTGLVHLGARHYDPAIGRFISVDPIMDLASPQQWNGYSYANNSPITLSDPSGLDPGGGQCYDDLKGKCSPTWGEPRKPRKPKPAPPPGSTATGDRNVDRDRENAKAAFLSTFNDDFYACRGPGGICGQLRGLVAEGRMDPYKATIYALCAGDASCIQSFTSAGGNIETALTILGFLPVVGEPADVTAAAIAFSKGDWKGGLLSLVAATPIGPIASLKRLDRLGDAAATGCRRFSSFSGDTRVLMADGTTKPIQVLKPGDMVWATDPETGEQGPRQVTHIWVHQDQLVELRLTNGGTLTTTEDHPFWNQTDQQWQQAQDLDKNDLLHATGVAAPEVVSLDWQTTHQDAAYNLTVADLHTYYVLAGNTPVLVHNCPDDIPAGPKYENPGHHDPRGGPNPYNPKKAVLPGDAAVQFGNSVLVDGTRWTKIGTGKSAVYYRYFDDGNGNWHWSGSTNGVNNRGVQVSIPLDQVPISVRRS